MHQQQHLSVWSNPKREPTYADYNRSELKTSRRDVGSIGA